MAKGKKEEKAQKVGFCKFLVVDAPNEHIINGYDTIEQARNYVNILYREDPTNDLLCIYELNEYTEATMKMVKSIVDGCYNCPLEKIGGYEMQYGYCGHPRWDNETPAPDLPRCGNPPPDWCPLRKETLVTKVRLRIGPI